MCGRYVITSPLEGLRALFDFEESPNLAPRYNAAPGQDLPVVRRTETGRNALAALRWGLIPSWSKDAAAGYKMINARSETAADKPSFRSAFKQRRCLVPADGWYEWVKDESGKQPYLIRLADDRPFAFAGLWESWRGEDERPIETFTILTTQAAPSIEGLHHRMPCVLDDSAARAAWTAPDASAAALAALLRPYSGALSHHPVARAVGNVRNDDPSLIEPATIETQEPAPRADGGQMSLL